MSIAAFAWTMPWICHDIEQYIAAVFPHHLEFSTHLISYHVKHSLSTSGAAVSVKYISYNNAPRRQCTERSQQYT